MFIKKVIGLVISMSGVIFYTYLNLSEKSKQKASNDDENDKNFLLNIEEEEEDIKEIVISDKTDESETK